MTKRFWCHEDKMHLDSWTYGDWRQYVCDRRNGDSYCARPSVIPPLLLALCLFFGAVIFIILSFMPAEAVRTNRVAVCSAVVIAIPIALLLARWRGYHLMVAVGPPNKNGRRVLPGEVAP